MRDITFANPGFFYLFILLGLLLVWYFLKGRRGTASIKVSGLESFPENASGSAKLRHLFFGLRLLAFSLFIVALARPQSTNSWEEVSTEGIDVVMAMDVSGSMRAMDFKPNRLKAAVEVGREFVLSRPDDRFGLVVFSGESFTQCPLTTDKAVVANFLSDLDFGMLEDGTAIGMGLSTAVNRLKDSDTESKVIILLTDGVNNQGQIGPVTAAELAAVYGIRVYTIGVGTMGNAPYPVQDMWGRTVVQQVPVEIDEAVLKDIANLTGGKYFRATDKNKLISIYEEIDAMEKTQLDVKQFSKRKDEYFNWLLWGLVILGLEVIIRYTIYRSIP